MLPWIILAVLLFLLFTFIAVMCTENVNFGVDADFFGFVVFLVGTVGTISLIVVKWLAY
jgi:hypothetical protein